MMGFVTRDGRPWQPRYLEAVDITLCIGCGRCFKVCGRGVLAPTEKLMDDDGEECAAMVMSAADAGACIGCEACAKVCARQAHTHVTVG